MVIQSFLAMHSETHAYAQMSLSLSLAVHIDDGLDALEASIDMAAVPELLQHGSDGQHMQGGMSEVLALPDSRSQHAQPALQPQQLLHTSVGAGDHAIVRTEHAEGVAASQRGVPIPIAALQPEQLHPAYQHVHADLHGQPTQHMAAMRAQSQPQPPMQHPAVAAQTSHAQEGPAAQQIMHGPPAGLAESMQAASGQIVAAAQQLGAGGLSEQVGQPFPQPSTPQRQQQAMVQVHPLLPVMPQGQLVFTPPWKTNLAAPFQQCIPLDPSGQKYTGPGVFDAQAGCVVFNPSTNSYHALASAPLPGVHPGPSHPCGNCGHVSHLCVPGVHVDRPSHQCGWQYCMCLIAVASLKIL